MKKLIVMAMAAFALTACGSSKPATIPTTKITPTTSIPTKGIDYREWRDYADRSATTAYFSGEPLKRGWYTDKEFAEDVQTFVGKNGLCDAPESALVNYMLKFNWDRNPGAEEVRYAKQESRIAAAINSACPKRLDDLRQAWRDLDSVAPQIPDPVSVDGN